MNKIIAILFAGIMIPGIAFANNVHPLAAYDNATGIAIQGDAIVLSKPYDSKTFVSVYIQGQDCAKDSSLNVVVLDKNQHMITRNINNGCSLKLDFTTKVTGLFYIGLAAKNQDAIKFSIRFSDAPSEIKKPVETGSVEGDEP